MLGLSDIAKLRTNVQAAVEQCLAISARLEHGKAETPFSDPFAAVLDSLEQQHFYMAVIEITGGSSAALLRGWEIDATFVWKKLPDTISAIEVRFHAQGYRWQCNGSRLHSAESLDAIVEQVADVAGRGELARKLMVLYVPGDSARSSTRILLIRSADLVGRDPNLMLLLNSSAHLVIISGAADHVLSMEERGVLAEIVGGAQAVLPLAVSHEDGMVSTWANAATLGSSCAMLEPMLVSPEQSTPDHPVFQQGSAPRTALQYTLHARRLRDAVERLQVGLEHESRSITSKQTALAESERELDETAKVRDPRGELERIKVLVDDATSALLEQIDEINRKATQKKGALTQLVRDISASIDQESLVSVTHVRKIRKSMDPKLVAEHTAQITKALRAQLMQDVALVSAKTQELTSQVQDSLTSAGIDRPRLALPPFEHEKTWQYLQGELSLEGKGELEVDKATGVMFFMNGARSIIMPIFMTLSMVGINLRSQLTKKSASTESWEQSGSNWFGPALMISGFVLAGLYFFLEKRKEREEQMHRDINKIRDSLLNDASRMVSDVQRDKVSRIGSYIGEFKKAIVRQSEQILKSRYEQSQRELDKQKREIKARLRALDASSREQVEFNRQLAKVQQTCAELLGSCTKLLVEAAPTPRVSTAERKTPQPLPERPARDPIAERPPRESRPERPPRLSIAERRALRERG